MSAKDMQDHQQKLITHAMTIGALKFGEFKLKSGRTSPYFFNAAEMNTGPLIDVLASAYAALIASLLVSGALPRFDLIFGPAYKGIPLAATVALLLWREHGVDIGWAYDRKEAKAHGEGGVLVGMNVANRRILILDDVVTAGTAIRGALDNITKAGGHVVGVIVCLDREEVGPEFNPNAENPGPRLSTVNQVAAQINGPVHAILRMRDLMSWLEARGPITDLQRMETYWKKYGVDN